MRNIKFRAWNSQQNLMVEDANYLVDSTPDAAILMQYTGLKDKNNVDIYEGDIVKMYDEDDRENICEVIFNQGGFIVEWDSNFAGGEADLTTVGWAIEEGIEIEVIGNIFQNKELLK